MFHVYILDLKSPGIRGHGFNKRKLFIQRVTKPDTAENLIKPVGKTRRKLNILAVTGTYTMDETLYGSKHSWYFSLDKNLRMKIQFDRIEIVYMNLMDCTIGKVHVESHALHSKSLYSTYFCGSHPIVTVVPPFQMTEIIIWAIYRPL